MTSNRTPITTAVHTKLLAVDRCILCIIAIDGHQTVRCCKCNDSLLGLTKLRLLVHSICSFDVKNKKRPCTATVLIQFITYVVYTCTLTLFVKLRSDCSGYTTAWVNSRMSPPHCFYRCWLQSSHLKNKNNKARLLLKIKFKWLHCNYVVKLLNQLK